MGGYDDTPADVAGDLESFFADGLINAVGGCCGTTPDHISAIRECASKYPKRIVPNTPHLLRLSGLEPSLYMPNEANMRATFMNVGERCNVAGSMAYKKAIVDGDYEKAAAIALKQV